jgi:hypothetical protein
MSKTIESPILLAELIVIAAPLTLLAWLLCGSLVLSPWPINAAMLLAYIGLVGFWGVSLRFLFGGAAGAKSSHPVFWLCALIGAALSIASPVGYSLYPDAFAGAQDFYEVGAFGVPLLLPLGHVMLITITTPGRAADGD